MLGASYGHGEVVDKLRGLHVDPLWELILPKSDEVSFVKVRDEIAVVKCWGSSLTIDKIDDIYMESTVPTL